MSKAEKFAGFLAAHAVMSISEGEKLIPLYGYINESNEGVAVRMEQDRIEWGVAAGKEMMETNPHNSSAAIFIHDIFLNVGSDGEHKIDVLHIEFKTYGNDAKQILMGVPYKHNRPMFPSFAVFELDIYQIPIQMSEDSVNTFFASFFDGVNDHQEGSEIWHGNTVILPANVDKYEAIITNQGYVVQPTIDNAIQDQLIAKYDDASWHYNNDFPEDLSEASGATHIGMFVAWCVLNGLAGNVTEVKKLADRMTTPGIWFYDVYGGKFTHDILNDQGNAFANEYFNLDSGDYLDDYESVLDKTAPSIYHMPDTWKTYEALNELIRSRFESMNS